MVKRAEAGETIMDNADGTGTVRVYTKTPSITPKPIEYAKIDPKSLPQGWFVAYAQGGQPYFYTKANVVQWEMPTKEQAIVAPTTNYENTIIMETKKPPVALTDWEAVQEQKTKEMRNEVK